MPRSGAVLFSIRPEYAAALLAGSKTVELRRVGPRSTQPGDLALLYASAPKRALIGLAEVESVTFADAAEIWRRYGRDSGLSEDEFDAYYLGASRPAVIALHHVRALAAERPLTELRRRLPGYRPPQNFRYCSPSELAALGISC